MDTMTTISQPDHATMPGVSTPVKSRDARRVRGLSDRAIAWLFVAPTIALLLAINIFPLIWMIRLSFTNLNLSMSYLPLRFVGLDNFRDILTDEDVWFRLQTTAQFVISSVALQVVVGFGLALLINRQFRGHSFWTTIILLPMMLSPAVVGNFWTLLLQPQIGPFNYLISLFTGVPPSSFSMTGQVSLAPWTIVLVDTWMWAPYVMLICLAGLRSIPDYIYEAAEVDRASAWRQFWSITLPMTVPFLM
ncbi:carbohydrate ABC transporter permease, partial [Bradyrhizobium sp.]